MTRLSFATGTVILLAWAITMGFLLRNHYIKTDAAPAYTNQSLFGSVEAVQKWRDVKEYMIVKQGVRTIGASLTEVRQVQDTSDTLTYVADFRLNVKVSPILPVIMASGKSVLNQQMELEEIHAKADLGPAGFSATGFVEDDKLYLQTSKPTGITSQVLELTAPISLAEAVRPALGSQLTIAPGNVLRTQVIDPLTGTNRGTLTITVEDQEEIAVNGKPTKAYRVRSSIQDLETLMWVDAYGQTLKRNLVGDFTMERAAYEDILKIAPELAESIEIPNLKPDDFKNIPIQKQSTSSAQPDSTLSALRTFF